jgi:hypothetical protein
MVRQVLAMKARMVSANARFAKEGLRVRITRE